MKSLIVIAAVVLGASVSQAALKCGVTRETVKGSNTFDTTLYFGDLEASKLLLLSEDKQSVRVLDLTSPEQYKNLKEIDGKSVVMFSKNSDSSEVFIGTGKINMANASTNLLTLKSGGSFSAPTTKAVGYMIHGLMLMCFEM